MTEEKFEEEMENNNLDSEYAEYIMNKNDGRRIITSKANMRKSSKFIPC